MEYAGNGLAGNRPQREYKNAGKWNDPNPATQTVARDLDEMAEEVKNSEDISNLHSQFFHISRESNYKNVDHLDDILDTRGTSDHPEVENFYKNTIASGENNLDEAAGNNPIHEDNRNEAQIRYGGKMYALPLVSSVNPPGTNEAAFVQSTIFDKQPLRLPTQELDTPLLPVVFGNAPLRPDTQISGANTDTGDNPLLISQFLDRNQLFDEGRETMV